MLNETLLPLNEVPAHLPKRKGRPIHAATVYRWAQKGAHGRRLETCRAGGILLTSLEALSRFLEVSDYKLPKSARRQNSRAVERAEAELAAAGL